MPRRSPSPGAPARAGSSHARSCSSRAARVQPPSPPVSPPPGRATGSPRRVALKPQPAMRAFMHKHPVLFAEPKEVREKRARDHYDDKHAATTAEQDSRLLRAGRVVTAEDKDASRHAAHTAAKPPSRSKEDALVWQAAQLVTSTCADPDILLARLNAYDFARRPYYAVETAKGMTMAVRREAVASAVDEATSVQGPDGLLFQHRKRLTGRPLETVGVGGETMNSAQKRIVIQAIAAAKEASNGIVAATNEFALRPANKLDRLAPLAEEEATETKRLEALEELLTQVRLNRALYELAEHERNAALVVVAKMDKDDLDELKNYKEPPEAVRRTLVAVVTLVTENTAAADLEFTKIILTFQQFVGGMLTAKRLADALRQYDPTKGSEPILTAVNSEYCKDVRWCYENVSRASPSVAPLCLWVHAQITIWDSVKRMEKIEADAESANLSIDRSAQANIALERGHISNQVHAVEESVKLLSRALTSIAGMGVDADVHRKQLLLWRSQLLGLIGKSELALRDNELLTQISTGAKSTSNRRVAARRLATSAWLARTSQGPEALHHAHSVAVSIIAEMSNKKITPSEADDTERCYGIALKTYARERSFRDPIVPHRLTVSYPDRYPDRDHVDQQNALNAWRRRRLMRLRRRQTIRRSELVRLLKSRGDQKKQDQAAFSARRIKGVLDKQWRPDTWVTSDFFEVQQPFDRVRTRLVQALDLAKHNQKLSTDSVPLVHASLKFVGLPSDTAGVLLSGLCRADLGSRMVDMLIGCTPPSTFVDLKALLQVLHDAKPIFIDAFTSIVVAADSTLLESMRSAKQVKPENLLIHLSQFCECIDDAGALDEITDTVMLDKIFVRSLTTQAVKNSAGGAPSRDRASNDTASSRRMRTAAVAEMSLLGFVMGIVRVAALRSIEIPSLHQRVDAFIQTELVQLVANRNAKQDDDITIAARQPVVTKVLNKWGDCIRACFMQYCLEDDVTESTDKDGNVDVNALAINLQDFLRMCHQLGWYDERFTGAQATALFFQVAKPEDGQKVSQILTWERMSVDEAEAFATSEELELVFDQFQALMIRTSFSIECLSRGSEPDKGFVGQFDEQIAEVVEKFIQDLILPKYNDGSFSTQSGNKPLEDEDSRSDYASANGPEEHEASDSDSMDSHGLNTAERKKIATGMRALTRASDEAGEAKARAELSRLEYEAQQLAAEAQAKSHLDDKEVRQLFNEIDADRSGFLDNDEVQLMMTRLHIMADDQSIDRIMEEMDPDKDGKVTMIDFLTWWHNAGSELKSQLTSLNDAAAARKERERRERNRSKRGGELSISEVRLLFDELDVDGSGTLDKNEIRELMRQLGVALDNRKLNRVMSTMDSDGDGQVDAEEFVLWWKAAGVGLKNKLTALTDETLEQKDQRLRAQTRENAAQVYRQAAQKKMREAELQRQRAQFHSWRRKVYAIKQFRGGLKLRDWNKMTKQQRALHTAGIIATGQGHNLRTAAGRVLPRRPQPPRTRKCTQCGAEFVLLAHDAPTSGTGKTMASKQAIEKITEQTKKLIEVEPKLQAAIAVHDAIMKADHLVAKEHEFLSSRSIADMIQLQEVYDLESAKLAQFVKERKQHTKVYGERRLIPNRDLCEEHRPRLCKYTQRGYGGSTTCGRIFTLADAACRLGGRCCEDTAQI